MGSITDATILHHVCIVLLLLWLLSAFGYCHPVAYFVSLIYLYFVHEGYVCRLTKKLQFEEKRDSNQRRVLSDSETVRWLNHTVEKMWLVCMEDIVSQKILLPIVPWFLQKYKPWTVKDIEVQSLYLGRSPPIITEMRVLPNSNGDDHLVMELGMNFRTADDMSAILGVKLRKRLGFGMSAKLHLLGMHIEGKVLVGVKFLQKWPFIGRLRVCFAEPPYFQMTVKPIFTHGLDVTELPGIAGWIDNLLALVFEQTLVEPNMLVVDLEKFVSPQSESWFSVDAKEPIAHAIVEVIEAVEMNPSDLNGLADPYVKGQLGPYRFRTKTQKKTLAPKWLEEFKIPICTWESQNVLVIEVRDKDHIFDDMMGDCSVNINELRDGQRHDLWLPLKNIKMGRLHLAVTVSENDMKGADPSFAPEDPESDYKKISLADAEDSKKGSFSSRSSEKSPRVADKFEPIDIEGKENTGIWIHHPGSEVAQVWEPRKGKSRSRGRHQLDRKVQCEGGDPVENLKPVGSTSSRYDSSSSDETADADKPRSNNPVHRGLRKIGSIFHKSPRNADSSRSFEVPEPSPRPNIRASNAQESGVRLIVADTALSSKNVKEDEKNSTEESGPESPMQRNVKDRAKNMLKQAGKSANILKVALSRKASRKSKAAEPRLAPTNEDGLDPNSSDGESLSSAPDVPLTEDSTTLPDSSSIKSDHTVPNGAQSGNNSSKPEDTVQTTKDGSVQASNNAAVQCAT